MIIAALMSGTSVDSIDAVCVKIEGAYGALDILPAFHVSYPWPELLRNRLLLMARPGAFLSEAAELNMLAGEQFALAVHCLANTSGLPLDQFDAIASHGQTVLHKPPSPGSEHTAYTVQIGEPAVIAARTGRPVVADFRQGDIAVGGQGAPLVPYADYMLFRNRFAKQQGVAIQNIGGIGNVTYIPRGAGIDDVVAFDNGPGNMLMDAIVSRLTGGREQMDLGGEYAQSGKAHSGIVNRWLALPYFSQPPPKSTGRDLFGETEADRLIYECMEFGLTFNDVVATALEITVSVIEDSYNRFLMPRGAISHVVVGGGGADNPVLLERLRQRLSPAVVLTHSQIGIDNCSKEAIAFALLAYETLHGRPSNVSSATGGASRAVLGKICLPPLASGWDISITDRSILDNLSQPPYNL